MTKNKTYKIQTLGLDLYESLDQGLVRDLQHELIEVQGLHSAAEETLEEIADSFTSGDFDTYSTDDKLRASADLEKYETRIEAIRKQLSKAENVKSPPPLDQANAIAWLIGEAHQWTIPVYVMATQRYQPELVPKGNLPAVVVLPSKAESRPSAVRVTWIRTPMHRTISVPLLAAAAKEYGIKLVEGDGPSMNSQLQRADAVISAPDQHMLHIGNEVVTDSIEWLGRTPVVYEELPPANEIDHDTLAVFAKGVLNQELSAAGVKFDLDDARNHQRAYSAEVHVEPVQDGVLKFRVSTAMRGTEALGAGESDAIHKRLATLSNEGPRHLGGVGYAINMTAHQMPSHSLALGASRWYTFTAEVVADPVAHKATRRIAEAA